MPERALIIGISGQDGSYLSKLLVDKGFEVYGTSRDAEVTAFSGLKTLGIYDKVNLVSMSLTDFRSTMQVILDLKPDYIFNLAGQSSVGLSFMQPVETLESISVGTLNVLEVIRFHKLKVKFYNASSSECFGNIKAESADELTPFHPTSPYAVAKAAAFWQVANYRNAYKLFACSGILFNHESPLRHERFVTKKIVKAACRISKGSDEILKLGNISIVRDWGWAPDFVKAMMMILEHDKPEDFVIATGKAISLENFVKTAFEHLNLDYKKHIEIDKSLFRPHELNYIKGNPEKAKKELGWVPAYFVDDVIKAMIEFEMNKNS